MQEKYKIVAKRFYEFTLKLKLFTSTSSECFHLIICNDFIKQFILSS